MASGHCALWRHRRLWTVAHLLSSCESLEDLLIGKRVIDLAAITQDDMVEDFDAEGFAREHQLAREQAVFLAGPGAPEG